MIQLVATAGWLRGMSRRRYRDVGAVWSLMEKGVRLFDSLVTPAQAGYERMRERQKQRRDAANGAPKPAPEPHVLGSDPVEGDAFVARLELSMYEKDGGVRFSLQRKVIGKMSGTGSRVRATLRLY